MDVLQIVLSVTELSPLLVVLCQASRASRSVQRVQWLLCLQQRGHRSSIRSVQTLSQQVGCERRR